MAVNMSKVAFFPGVPKGGTILRKFMSKEKRKALDNIDVHHGDESKDKWDAFLDKSKRKSFVKAMQNDPRTDKKLHRHVDQMNRLQSGKPVGKVGQYDIVRKRGGGLACTCPDWRYRRSVAPEGQQDCKHIREHKRQKRMGEKTAHVLDVYEKVFENLIKKASFPKIAKKKEKGQTARQSRILGAFSGGVGGATGGGAAGILPGAATGALVAHPTHHAVNKTLKGDYKVLRGPISKLVSSTAGGAAGRLTYQALEAMKKH